MRPGRFAAAFVVAALLTAGCGLTGGGRGSAPLQNLGSASVGASNAPDPPTTGENVMTIVVVDAAGKPVRGATVDVAVWMPAMGAMPYMESRGRVRETWAGVYRASYALAMAGDWEATIRVQPREGPPVSGGWRVSTNQRGLAFIGGEVRPAEGANAEWGGTSAGVMAGMNHGGTGGAAADSLPAGAVPSAVTIDPTRRQSLGIKVEAVAARDLVADVRAAGRVAYDETRLAEVSPRFSGWVRAIHADFVGQPVRRGEALFDIYSPDLWSAQQELLQALQAAREDSARGGGTSSAELAAAARRRLALWDLSDADIERIARAGRPRETLPVRSPATGVVTAKSIVLGSPVTAGQVVYSIAPTDPVWVLASVYEQDLPLMRVGMMVELNSPTSGGRARRGRISFIAPDLAADTRTGTVRIEVPNGQGELKPGTYLEVHLNVALGRRLAIPESAVLPTGERRIVFVDLGDGKLAPRDVSLGAHAGGWYEVRGGLVAGDRVVTSGNFLVAAESRLRSATGKW